MRNFTVDVDQQLRGKNKDLNLDELVKLTQLVKYGVTAGDTGPEALPAADAVKKLPQGAEFQLQMLLSSIDAEKNVEIRDTIVEEWKAGFNMNGRPFRSNDGFFRLHLLDFTPSTPADIDGPDGKIKPAIYGSALADMIAQRAHDLNHANAEAFESKLRQYFIAKEDGKEVPDAELAEQYEALPTETITYLQIADSNYPLGRLPIGDMMGPNHYRDQQTGESGEEIVVMADRRVPDRATFDAESDAVKNEYRNIAGSNYQSQFGFTFTMNGPVAIIHPSPAIMGGIADRFTNGRISVNPELVRSNEG
jgi:hypothetical protein